MRELNDWWEGLTHRKGTLILDRKDRHEDIRGFNVHVTRRCNLDLHLLVFLVLLFIVPKSLSRVRNLRLLYVVE